MGVGEDGARNGGAVVDATVTDALVVVCLFSHSRSDVFTSVSLPIWLTGSDVVELRVVMVMGNDFVFLAILFSFLVILIVFFIVVVEVAFVVLVVMAAIAIFNVSGVLGEDVIMLMVD